jgi:hypothetical protein
VSPTVNRTGCHCHHSLCCGVSHSQQNCLSLPPIAVLWCLPQSTELSVTATNRCTAVSPTVNRTVCRCHQSLHSGVSHSQQNCLSLPPIAALWCLPQSTELSVNATNRCTAVSPTVNRTVWRCHQSLHSGVSHSQHPRTTSDTLAPLTGSSPCLRKCCYKCNVPN